MVDLPERPFDTWTLAEVEAAASEEPVDVMPGSGRCVIGPRRKLLAAMRAAEVKRAGDLPRAERDHHLFLPVGWPRARARGAAIQRRERSRVRF